MTVSGNGMQITMARTCRTMDVGKGGKSGRWARYACMTHGLPIRVPSTAACKPLFVSKTLGMTMPVAVNGRQIFVVSAWPSPGCRLSGCWLYSWNGHMLPVLGQRQRHANHRSFPGRHACKCLFLSMEWKYLWPVHGRALVLVRPPLWPVTLQSS